MAMETVARVTMSAPMLASSSVLPALPAVLSARSQQHVTRAATAQVTRRNLPQRRRYHKSQHLFAQNSGLLGINSNQRGPVPRSYFQGRPALPTNTVIRFVPQQTAWVVERMGKFSRILEPGLAILMPVIDRIAYVKSLKEAAIEIPSQTAITADNVTLALDGVLYTRVTDAYKAR